MILLCASVTSVAQSQAEKELLKSAEKQFEEGQFLDALPSYRQLLSISPESKDYNYKYGACLLSSDEDVAEAVKHLAFACKGGSYAEAPAYFYLGKAYHLDYRFADALTSYGTFKNKADNKQLDAFREVDRLMSMAENGKQLLSAIKDIKVLDKTESTLGEFFRNYDLAAMGGSVIKVPEELLSSKDKKMGHSPIMYFPQEGGTEIIFSSYGNADHLDLYSVQRTGAGGFTKPQKLGGVVNSPFDEDYPFLHADGRTLYFSSKGHTSMGGFDVFKSKRNLSTGLFESPENLDFAISSPDNDIFYVVDKEKRIAFFASDRNSEDGRVHVYQVAVSNGALDLAIAEGKVTNDRGGSQVAQIKVLDANTNQELGIYRSDEDGNYLLDLPGTGKYKLFIDLEDSDITHTAMIDLPSFGEVKAFSQDITLKEVAGQEKVIVQNNYEGATTTDVMVLMQEVLKRKAALDVNFTGTPEIASEASDVPFSADDVLVKAGFESGTPIDEVTAIGEEQANAIAQQIEMERSERDKAYGRSEEAMAEAELLMTQAEETFADAEKATGATQEELKVEAAVYRAQSNCYIDQAAVSLELATQLDKVIESNESLLDDITLRNEALSASIENQDSENSIQLLAEVKTSDDKGITQVDAVDRTSQIASDKRRKTEQVIQRVTTLRQERDNAVAAITTKETQLGRTSKSKEKKVLEAELTALRAELPLIDEQLARSSDRLDEAQTASDISTESAALLEQLRLGQDPALAALQPLSIPTGGLKTSADRLKQVRKSGSDMAISDLEVKRILTQRPDLISRYGAEQQQLLAEIRSIDDPEAVSPIADAASTGEIADTTADEASETPDDTSVSDSLAQDATDAVTTLEDTATNTTDTASESIADATDAATAATDKAAESEELASNTDNAKSGDIPTESTTEATDTAVDAVGAIDAADSSLDSATDAVNTTGETLATTAVDEDGTSTNSIEEATATPDYRTYSLDDLLKELNADYTEAETQVLQSDMRALEKAEARIDLKRSALQRAEQKITVLEYSSDYASNAQKQSNVKVLQAFIENSETEILDIAKESEALTAQEDALAASQSTATALPNTLSEIAARTALSENLDAHYQSIAVINSDTTTSDRVKIASRMKQHSLMVDEVRAERIRVEQSPERDETELAALASLMEVKEQEMNRELSEWEDRTGVVLLPAEQVLAKNKPTYITERSIIESAASSPDAVAVLNKRTAQSVRNTIEARGAYSEDVLLDETEWEQLARIADQPSVSDSVDAMLADGSTPEVNAANDTAIDGGQDALNTTDRDVSGDGIDVSQGARDDTGTAITETSDAADATNSTLADGADTATNTVAQTTGSIGDDANTAIDSTVDSTPDEPSSTASEIASGLQTAIEINATNPEDEDTSTATPEEGITDLELAALPDISTIIVNDDWTAALFDQRDSRAAAKEARNQLVKANTAENLSSKERLEQEAEASEAFLRKADEEIVWKRELLALQAKDRSQFPAVQEVVDESRLLDAQAEVMRAEATVTESPLRKNELLRKAMRLEMVSLDNMTKALELDGHLSKGKSLDKFKYQEAVVIDLGADIESEQLASLSIDDLERTAVSRAAGETASNGNLATNSTSAETAGSRSTETLLDASPEDKPIIDSPKTLEEELAAAPVAESKEELDMLPQLSSYTAINTYPKISQQLTQSDILPILDYEEEMGLFNETQTDRDVQVPDAVTDRPADEIAPILSRSVDIKRQERYRRQLQTSVTQYEAASSERKVRAAEVIDLLADSPEDKQLLDERARLSAEMQVIESYIDQAKTNSAMADEKIADLRQENEQLVAEITPTVSDDNAARVSDYVRDGETADSAETVTDAAIDVSNTDETIADEPLEASDVATSATTRDADTPAATEATESASSSIEEASTAIDDEASAASNSPVAASEPATPPASYSVFELPEVLTTDIFKMGAAKPARAERIPIDMAMPSGTIYQVQVGAFRKPIPDDLFSEFQPIMGERIRDGITRYKVGLFQAEDAAVIARDEIRALGYRDAFVVRYIDGSRDGGVIANDIASATTRTSETAPDLRTSTETRTAETAATREASARGSQPTGAESSAGRNTGSNSTASNGDRGAAGTTSAANRAGAGTANPKPSAETAYYDRTDGAAPAHQVEVLKGLFYTVQVGVYSKPVNSSSIYDISPLNSELTANGYIKYTSGIFDDITIADQWKQKIISKGVSDAFVTAYYDGKKVTLDRAAQIRASQGEQILIKVEELDELENDRQGQVVWELVSTSELFSEEVREQIKFKIRLGPYYDRIPDKDVAVILDYKNKIEFGRRDDGAIIYTTKIDLSFDEAQEAKEKYLASGISNANIIALQDGVEIPVQRAMDFLLK